MANLTRSDKNSKCAYHFHMVKKEEVETQRPHSALVMVRYKSDMTGKSHSVDKTKNEIIECNFSFLNESSGFLSWNPEF